jgi:hypothetical protein
MAPQLYFDLFGNEIRRLRTSLISLGFKKIPISTQAKGEGWQSG